MTENNIILNTDSYKIGGHWNMMLPDTEIDYCYYEARKGSKFDEVIFFGLQYILKKFLVGKVVTQEKIDEAADLCYGHFGNKEAFNLQGWQHILDNFGGYLPVLIKAAPEGLSIPVSNVLFTTQNIGGAKTSWLPGYLESKLSHVWYPTTIATSSRDIRNEFKPFIYDTCDASHLDFLLHDFAYRSYTGEDSAAIGGLAHLVSFLGTDTVPALKCARDYYEANSNEIAYSVPATQHSTMSALGEKGESKIVSMLIDKYPTGILSVVGDTYDIYNFVSNIICVELKDKILARNGVFVVRPDSVTERHPTKASLVLWIVNEIYNKIGGTINKKGYKVMNSKLKALYGDGLDKKEMIEILQVLKDNGFSAENLATFGCGSGLVQKNIHRDVCRFAYKTSAQFRDGRWHDIFKNPLDKSKASKRGLLKLIKDEELKYKTVNISEPGEDILTPVFSSGKLLKSYSFKEVRQNSNS